MTFAARIPTFASGDPYAGSLLATDFTRNFYKAPGFVGSDFSRLPGLTVTRATPAVSYAQTASGLLVPFAANVARVTDQGLLVEEARTNVLLRSQTFTNAAWAGNATNVTTTDNALAAPDGTVTAASFVPAAGAVNVGINQTITVTNTTVYTYSIFLKNGALGNNWIEVTTVSGSALRTWFNLATGAVGTVGHTSASITALANGWYRAIVTFTSGATSLTAYFSPRDANANNATVTGNGASVSNYAWGAQVE